MAECEQRQFADRAYRPRPVSQRRSFQWLAAIYFAIGLTSMLRAVEPAAIDASTAPSGVRQIFVPADRPDTWPTHNETFLPIAPEQLRKLIQQGRRSDDGPEPAREHAVEAVYYARYIANRLIDGQGCVGVTAPEQALLLDWPHSEAMIRNPRWKDRDSEPIRLGVWGANDSSLSRPGLFVDQSGILLFSFQTPASAQTDNSTQFTVASPRALRRRLFVDLPEHHELESEDGAIALLTDSIQVVTGSQGSLMELPPLGIGYRRWQLTNGPGGTQEIRVKQPPLSAGVRNDASPYREQLSYALEPEGMVLTATFQFLEGDQLPPELNIDFDPRLKLVGAQWQGQGINWQEQAIGSTGTPRVRVAIPQTGDRQPQLRIEAWGDLPPNELRPLPQISLPDLFWTEGILDVQIADELELLDLSAGGLSPLSLETPSQSRRRGLWRLAKLRPQATAEVALREARHQVNATIGTSLELSSASTKAIIRMQLRTSGRTLPPRLEAEVLGDWVIDSVESSSAIGFTDWYVDRIDGRRLLRVQFREPGDATYPGEVVIEAHLPKSAAAESLTLAQLKTLDWRSLQPERHLLAVTVIEPFDLEFTGKVDRLSFDDLTESDWELLQNSDVAALILMKEADLRTSLQLLPERPAFDAELQIAVQVDREVVRQEVAVQMKPLRSPLSKLRVQLSPAPSSSIRWSDGHTGAQLSATRISDVGQEPRAGEIWEVQLSRAASGPQGLVASWTQESRDKSALPLIAIPDATKQTATLTIGSESQDSFDLTPTGLVRHPLANGATSGLLSDSIFRYDPTELLRDSAACRLMLDRSARGGIQPPTVVERVEISSRFSLPGESSHRADFVLRGAGPIRCWLPDGARLIGVMWDGRALEHALQMNELKLNPPARPADATSLLQIDYSLPEKLLHDGMLLEAPLPNVDLPLPVGQWTLELPSSFQLATEQYQQAIEPGWRGRLLGPWASDASDSDRLTAFDASPSIAGWRVWKFQFAGSLPPPVAIIAMDQRWSLAYGVGLAVGCFTAWQLVQRPRLLVVLIGVVAIAALWLPATMSLFATTAWLGMVFGIVGTAVAGIFGQTNALPSTQFSQTALLRATATSLIALLFFASPRLQAQAPEIAGSAAGVEGSKTIEVLIPVDSSGVLVGEQYFIPAHFLEELLQLSQQNRAERGGDWVLQRGRYQGELRQDTAGGEAVASIWSLSWELNVQRRNARVHFPIVREQGKWQPSASVDGIPVPLQWKSDGRGCEVLIREPGPHRVTMRVEPIVRADAQHATLQFDLPPVLDSELQLVYPSGLKDLDLPESALPTAADTQRSKVVFALPNSKNLELNWRLNAQASVAAAAWQVEQLELLTISPQGTDLEVRLLLQGPGRPPASVAVAIDGVLEPLEPLESVPGDNLASDARTVVIAPVTSQQAAPETDRATATLRFRLPRNQVLGNYRFLQVRVLDLVTRSKLAAVALSDRYSYETIQSPIGETMETSDFAELWGEPRSSSAAAYRILGDQTPWTIAVQPRMATQPPEESLLVSCGLTDWKVEFQAQFAAGVAPQTQQAIQVPPQLEVRSITLERSTQSEPLAWTRPTPDRIVAWFPEPLAGDFRLTLSAVVPRRTGGTTRVPTVTARPAENLLQHVEIHRRPECLVRIEGPARDRSNAVAASFDPWGTEAYLVEAFRDRPDRTAQLAVTIEKNPARSVAQSLTVFDPAVGVSFASRIQVTQGLLDRVNLEAPADWIGPLEITPPAQVVELGDSAQGRRQTQIQFINPVPAGQEIELRFNGSIVAPQDGTWIVPVLRLLGPKVDAAFAAVPEDEAAAENSWELKGVIPANLPAALRQGNKLPTRPRVFRILPSRAHDYVLRRSPATQDDRLVSLALANVYVREDASGSQIHTTQFLLPPIAGRELIAQWPEGDEPIGVYLENRLLTPLPIDGHRWRLPIGPTDLPVALTAVSRSAADATHRVKLHRPRLWDGPAEYPIPVTLWTIATPTPRGPNAGTGASAATAADVALLRLARLTQLVTAAEPRLAGLPAADRRAWTQLWSGRLRAENATLERFETLADARVGQTRIDDPDLATREQLIVQLNQLLGRLVEPSETINPPAIPADVGSLSPLADTARIDEEQRASFIVGGPQASLNLQAVESDPVTALPAAVITLFFVSAVGALLRPTSSIDVARWISNHPRWLVAALGIAGVLFLTPPAIGVALLAVATLSWAADHWLRRKAAVQ
ncbi:MAG: hypothetical protein WD851_02255 [Pirellulales bacterium]